MAPAIAELRAEHITAIAHDLPAIGLDLQLLRKARSAADVERTLVCVERSLASIDRMVHDLLDFGPSLDGHQLVVRRERLDLGNLVRDVVERTISIHDRHRVYVDIWGVSPVLGDGPRIERVVANFLDNAIKYASSSTSVVVEVDRPAGFARLSVIDGGDGLTPDECRGRSSSTVPGSVST